MKGWHVKGWHVKGSEEEKARSQWGDIKEGDGRYILTIR